MPWSRRQITPVNSSQDSPTSTTPSSTVDEDEGKSQGVMLSVDFSTPLVGAARNERVKQMTSKHPAFEKCREAQQILHNLHTSLRRMPGVGSNEAEEVGSALQKVSQTMSTETSQLVNAIANLELDLEDAKRTNVRLTIQEKLLSAEVDDKTGKISDLCAEREAETQKRELAEDEVKKIMEDLTKLSAEFKALKKSGSPRESNPMEGSASPRDALVKTLEDTIKHLEDQVNNRRSLWVQKNSDPALVARAIESLAGSEKTQEVTSKALASLRMDTGLLEPPSPRENGGSGGVGLHDWEGSVGSPQNSRGFQPPARPPTASSNRWSSMAVGFQRPGSTVNQDRRLQAPWSSQQPRVSSFSQSQSQSQPPSGFGRPPARQGYQRGSGRYRNAVPDFNASPYGSNDTNGNSRSGSSFSYGGRDQSQGPYPVTPQRNNRYRASTGSNGGQNSMQDYSLSQQQPPAPLIHLTEASVQAWNAQMMDFYSKIRSFVEKHASMPDYSSLVQIGRTPLWPSLLQTYDPLSEAEATSYLDFHLKEESSKSCLVTRVVIDYVVNRVWIPSAWLGSDRESNMDIMRLEDELEATAGQASHVRQPLLDRQSAIIDRIMSHRDKDSDFYKQKYEEITGSMMQMIGPLLNKLVHQNEAFADMQNVAECAWDLSSKILTSRLTFDFRFPEIGSRFSSQSMLPIWPTMDPMELQAKHWRVALVTTPVITCRNDTGTNISAHSVALADVVCMQ
ncbi:hypothetical protein CC79DRAFT_83427 [Sarocladium strictum]